MEVLTNSPQQPNKSLSLNLSHNQNKIPHIENLQYYPHTKLKHLTDKNISLSKALWQK